jgi:hypothetical protein
MRFLPDEVDKKIIEGLDKKPADSSPEYPKQP